MDNRENVGADSISAREETQREHMECSPTDPIQREPVGDGSPVSQKPAQPNYYVDLTREEFVAFRLLLARLNGPLRMRIPALIISLVCCAIMALMALEEWYLAGWKSAPDPALLVGALLVLLPGLYLWLYVPAKMKKTAYQQYDRSVSSGMNYCGRLTVTPDYVEKAGVSATAHIRLDERALFIEHPTMMVFTAAGSPALVLPARCLTEEMAAAARNAADRLPPRNRRFAGRVACGGQVVTEMPQVKQPEEAWVTTFTYTPDEYAAVTKSLIVQHFWKVSPITALTATCGAILFGMDSQGIEKYVIYFLVLVGVMTLLNLVLPLTRVKRQAQMLSPHDLTVQVRMDTLALRVKGQKGGENWVLWCDVDHVYDKGEFVEVVHNKSATLHIPKRCIEDIPAFEAALKRCRGK